ncbi:MAG: hypothetical protein MJ065_04330 [Oscillospiraceae bacterium]|nr:hypothetical protein [Oscillospiraceae bacterium]
MTLKEDGFHGIIEEFKDSIYTTFVKNGGLREINSNNIARELDCFWEYHISVEEEVVQVILFYYCLAEVIGYLPDFCFNTVNRYIRYIDKYREIDLSDTLSDSEQTEIHSFVSKLILYMQKF